MLRGRYGTGWMIVGWVGLALLIVATIVLATMIGQSLGAV